MSDVRKPARDRTGAEIAAAEMHATAERLHEMADAAEAGRNSVAIDVPGFHALAYYLESWSLSVCAHADRLTCRNVYDETKACACENGFECSECGGVVEDGEGWLVNGTFNFCPKCGARVVSGDE